MIHDSYLKKSGRRFQHTVEGLKDNVKGVEESMRSVKIRRAPLHSLAKAAGEY